MSTGQEETVNEDTGIRLDDKVTDNNGTGIRISCFRDMSRRFGGERERHRQLLFRRPPMQYRPGMDGYHAFQNNQCSAPGQSVRSVDQADIKRRALRIEGPARYLAAVNAALDLFKARAPHWYVYTVFGHDWSLELPEGTIVSPPPHVKLHLYTLAGSHLLDDICWFASHLVHYAAHNYQDERNMASGGSRVKLLSLEDEREALTVQIEALEATCPGHGTLPWWREILANIDNPEYQWWR